MEELKGRVALVTGGAIRVGRAIALELAQAGADIVVHCHSSRQEAGDTAHDIRRLGRRALVVQADLSTGDGVRHVFKEAERGLGTPDILVNNAGIFERLPFGDISEQALRRMFDVNFFGPFLCAQQAAERMRARGGGDIVNIVDVGGTSIAWERFAHYCSAKSALGMLTRVLAVELAKDGIRVNGVAPGAVLFPEDADEAERERVLARVPAAREGSAEDVARTVRFLISGPAYISGQIVAVDGGRSARG